MPLQEPYAAVRRQVPHHIGCPFESFAEVIFDAPSVVPHFERARAISQAVADDLGGRCAGSERSLGIEVVLGYATAHTLHTVRKVACSAATRSQTARGHMCRHVGPRPRCLQLHTKTATDAAIGSR
jgi:hypothetical protein